MKVRTEPEGMTDKAQYKVVSPRARNHMANIKRTGAFRLLDEREEDILDRRFGLGRKDAETLQSIGDVYGISRERVRQIINRALDTLGVDPWVNE
jgi:DNA-directed RNA polymerase sigma subunit (sigma70/sigma32)